MPNLGQNQKSVTDSVMEQLSSDLVRFQVDQWIHGKITGTVPKDAPLKISVNAFLEDKNVTKAKVHMQSISYSRGHERFSDFPKVEIDNAQLELNFTESTEEKPSETNKVIAEPDTTPERFTKMIPQKKLDTLTDLTKLDLSQMSHEELKVAYMALATKILLDNFGHFYALFCDEEGRSYIFRWRDCEKPTVRQIDEDILKKTQNALVEENVILYCREETYFSAPEIPTEKIFEKEGKMASSVPNIETPYGLREQYNRMRYSKIFPFYLNISWLFED